MKITKQQLKVIIRESIRESIRLLREEKKISQPWRGEIPIAFTLNQNDKKNVLVYKEGDAGKVFYLYSKFPFSVNRKDATLSPCGDSYIKGKISDECYKYRVVSPGSDANINFNFKNKTQEFYISGL